MANKILPTLSFVVRHVPGTGKCYWGTNVQVIVAGTVVATASLGGRYSQDQARQEWQRNRKRFTLTSEGNTPAGQNLIRLAA